MLNDKRISIKFEHTDENGYFYSAESKFEVFDGFNGFDSPLDELGRAFNIFLRQVGYAFDKEYILMESIDAEEYEALAEYLEEYRKRKAESNDD